MRAEVDGRLLEGVSSASASAASGHVGVWTTLLAGLPPCSSIHFSADTFALCQNLHFRLNMLMPVPLVGH